MEERGEGKLAEKTKRREKKRLGEAAVSDSVT